jgi:leucyl aminopeptidase (aminopeptidase T)
MLEYVNNFKIVAEHCMKVKPGQQVLIVADETARPILLGQVLRDVINSMGAEATMMIIKLRETGGQEPAKAVAAAMLQCDHVVHFREKHGMIHTNAGYNVTAARIRWQNMTIAPEEYYKKPVHPADYDRIESRTEKLAQLLTEADVARITSTAGTDITMSLKGRTAIANNPKDPLHAATAIPPGGEATLAPVEWTTEGVVAVDLHITGMWRLLRNPLIWTVKKGRITDVTGDEEDVKWMRELLAQDEGANVIGQLAIGTSHVIPKVPTGNNFDRGREGRVHIGIGRNDFFQGGGNFSIVHADALFGGTTIELDGNRVVENEALLL